MPASKNKIRYMNEYNAKNYKQIPLRLSYKNDEDIIAFVDELKNMNISINDFAKRAMRKYISNFMD